MYLANLTKIIILKNAKLLTVLYKEFVMQICIFEDDKIEQFNPLTFSRPVYDLVCGINTLREKIERYFPGKRTSLHCRKYLVESEIGRASCRERV